MRILRPIFRFESEKDVNAKIKKLEESIENSLSYLKLNDVDYGYSQVQKCEIPSNELDAIKQKCFNFGQKAIRKISG